MIDPITELISLNLNLLNVATPTHSVASHSPYGPSHDVAVENIELFSAQVKVRLGEIQF